MKEKTIEKEGIEWLMILHPFAWVLGWILCFGTGILLIITSFIPGLNIYIYDKFCKDDVERSNTPNPLIKL